MELFYLNVYYMVYMASFLASVGLAMTFLWLCCRRMLRTRRIKAIMERNVVLVKYGSELNGEDCPICLAPFEED
jgi:hypothetical protein